MKIEDLTKMTADELPGKLKAMQKELRELRFKQSKGEVKDITKKKYVRKDIARILTVMSQKGLKEKA